MLLNLKSAALLGKIIREKKKKKKTKRLISTNDLIII